MLQQKFTVKSYFPVKTQKLSSADVYLYTLSLSTTLLKRPVLHKLKYLLNVHDHQLTVIVQHSYAVWRLCNVQIPRVSETFITMGAQTIPNSLITYKNRNEIHIIGNTLMCKLERCVTSSVTPQHFL